MILGIIGENKTGKTTISLTAPKPLLHCDIDVGGFDRAKGRFKSDVSSGAIKSVPYPWPLQAEEDKITSGYRQIAKLVGVKELWYKLVTDYIGALKGKEQTIVFDTYTQLWELSRQGYLQELQERQDKGDKLRERLQPIEHGEPNTRMRTLINLARKYNKNLILIHYMVDEYQKRLVDGKVEEVVTGRVFAGWKYMEGQVDLVIETSVRKSLIDKVVRYTPEATIALSGLGLDIMGVLIKDPTWDKIAKLVEITNGA